MLVLAIFLCGLWSVQCANTTNHDFNQLVQDLDKRLKTMEQNSKQTIKELARQMIMQQLFVEERIRSDGDSGLKQVRVGGGGTRPYFVNTYTAGGVAASHDHANYDRTVGMGEAIAVLNGVEFRTRHNDYKLKMPHRKTDQYNVLEDIPFPPVPKSVVDKPTVKEQIVEMREYFRAFRDQSRRRHWQPHFKPVLCYLEGAWTTNSKSLEEPFDSDRHHLEASSWFDLQEKIRFMSSTGGKNNNENFSFLPTTVVNVTDDGVPVFAQWNYRIACHPVSSYLNLKHFNLVDDLAVRMRSRKNFTAFAMTRAARFSMLPVQGHYVRSEGHGVLGPRGNNFNKLDEIMLEIPGKDNYEGYLTDDAFGLLKHRVDVKNQTVLNAARYHRWYKVMKRGAMGLSIRKRGFSDNSLWVAKTTNPDIAETSVTDCVRNQHHHKVVVLFCFCCVLLPLYTFESR